MKKSSGRNSRSVSIQDTPSVPKSTLKTSKLKLKGAQSLTPAEQEAVDIMQALKEYKKSSKRQPGTGGSSKGTFSILGIPRSLQSSLPPQVKELDDKDGDVNYKGDDHDSNTQDADNEDVKTESDEDEIYKYKIRVRKDEDVEMKDAKVEESDKGDEEVTDAVKEEAEKTSEAKDDTKKTELPPLSSSLSVSSGFGDHFLKLSFDSSLVSTIKYYEDTNVSSLLDISILQETSQIYSPSIQKKHTTDLIYKYSLQHLPELTNKPTPTAEQEYEKSPSDILKIKKEQAEKQKKPQFTVKSTDKAALAETKESESSKKPSTTKETPKGKTPSKGSKTDKSALTNEPVKEPITEVNMDDGGDDVGCDDDQPQTTSEPKTTKTLNLKWFKQPPRPPTPNSKWNKRQVVLDQLEQPWFNQMVSASKDPLTFNDLMATPINSSKYMLNGPKIENLTQDILLGPAFNLLEGTCSSSHQTVAVDYFFNNDLEYLKTSDLELYKFKEGYFINLHLNDIENMLLLDVQHKLFHLDGGDIVDFIVSLRMFTRSLILKRRVKDLQLGVESYQKKLNITKPQKTFPEIEFKKPYTPSYDPPRIIYKYLNKQKRVLQANKLYKFSGGTLKSFRDKIHCKVLKFCLDYNTKMPTRKWTAVDRRRSNLMIELINKQMREREIIRNLERLVGATKLKMDYKLMMHTT
nr:hypothetical protein [Tanacetum cinerariifolium]